jgi:hypothetical protein
MATDCFHAIYVLILFMHVYRVLFMSWVLDLYVYQKGQRNVQEKHADRPTVQSVLSLMWNSQTWYTECSVVCCLCVCAIRSVFIALYYYVCMMCCFCNWASNCWLGTLINMNWTELLYAATKQLMTEFEGTASRWWKCKDRMQSFIFNVDMSPARLHNIAASETKRKTSYYLHIAVYLATVRHLRQRNLPTFCEIGAVVADFCLCVW